MANKKYLDYDGLKYLWSKINTAVEDVTGYETVNLTITDPSGGGVSTTVTVTYNSTTETYSYNSSIITFKIPSNISYTISFADIDGYKTPDPITRTSISNNSITFYISYNEKPLSVGIVDTDGNIIKISDWTGGSNCTGVYISDEAHSIIVAPIESAVAFGGYGTLLNITTALNESEAIADFNGQSNTSVIISNLAGKTDSEGIVGAPAAEYCRTYSKGCKGVGEWYLPSLGEINLITSNKTEVNEALTKISGSIIGSVNWMWSSTQYNSEKMWIQNWTLGYSYVNKMITLPAARPICKYN